MNTAYIDTLRELCSFSAGNAATGLSKLLKKKVRIAMPIIKIAYTLEEQKEFLHDTEDNMLIATLITFESGEEGIIVQTYTSKGAHKLVEVAKTGEEIYASEEFEESILLEIANLISGSLVSSLSNFIGETIEPAPPFILVGKEDKIFKDLSKRQKTTPRGAFLAQVKILIEPKDLIFSLSFIPFFNLMEKVWKIAKT